MKKILLLMVLCMILVLPACESTKPDGNVESNEGSTFTATETGYGGDVTVTISEKDGKIQSVKVDAPDETQDIGAVAAGKLSAKILETQSYKIDMISGATITSSAVLKAAEKVFNDANITAEEVIKQISTEIEEIDTDVVVVGGGTAGMTAALAASEKGANVVVIEKTGVLGGLSRSACGILGTETKLQKELGYEVSSEEIFNHINKYNHYRGNAILLRTVLERSGNTIDWLMENGVRINLSEGVTQKMHLDDPKTYHMWANSAEDFPALWESMQDDYGVNVRLFTTGKELITEDGIVKGVISEKEDGSTLIVNAKSVIVCTGGFGANEEMFKEETEVNYYNYFGYGNQGEGVKMSWAVGADKIGAHVMQIHLSDLVGSTGIFNRLTEHVTANVKDIPLMWVNSEGMRFCNEELVYDNVLWGNVAFSQGGQYMTIVDQATVDKLTTEGSDMPGAYTINGMGLFNPEGYDLESIRTEPMEGLTEDLELLISEGIVYKGSTLDELAEKTGMNPDKLSSTVERYNKAVTTGNDDLFSKPKEYLQYSIEEGPFYAITVRGSTYGSIGGVRINEEIKAVRADGTIIQGLYVAGNDAGGLYDNTYPDVEGTTIAFAMNTGRIAGENAADEAKK